MAGVPHLRHRYRHASRASGTAVSPLRAGQRRHQSPLRRARSGSRPLLLSGSAPGRHPQGRKHHWQRQYLRVAPAPDPPPQKPVTKAGPGDTQRLDGLRILAVDDYELNRLLLQEILSREGARVTLAESGSQAFKCLEQEGVEAFDIILTDIFMPGLDGYETARMIRKLAPELPIIGLVSENLPHEEERCTAAGIGDFMVKPLLPDILVERIWRMTRGGS